MNLKGKVVDRLKPEVKAKMTKTLERMTQIREADTIRLRQQITEKLKWLFEERQRGLTARQQHTQQIEELDRQLLRLDGAVLVLESLVLDNQKKKIAKVVKSQAEEKQSDKPTV